MPAMNFAAPAVALLISLASALLVERLARFRVLLDHPSDRGLHSQPTPRGGGIGIVAGVVIGYTLYARGAAWTSPAERALLIGVLLIATVSFVDDFRHVPAALRFTVHTFAAMLLVAAVVVPPLRHTIVLAAIAMIWIVGFTNAYNFMDGIDGIAGLQAVVAGLAWFAIGRVTGLPTASGIGLALAASALGFLIRNWPPAKIFMGDVGSATLGFVLSSLVVLTIFTRPHVAIAGLLPAWPFVFDTALTLTRRVVNRENIFQAHRSHLYQRLVMSGKSHAQVTLLYFGMAATGCLLSPLWIVESPYAATVTIVTLTVTALALLRFARAPRA
jgi:UDP-N-acetylmuramyl pentapeptide phosphotransferase/UDP-N-acetylglucosamine-1-phosphate transferase